DHVLHAVDLLLDRQRHRVDHGASAGAWVARRYRDGRRHHIWVLRHRQGKKRDDAYDDREDGNDIGQDRPLYEELGDHCTTPSDAAAVNVFICGSIFCPGTAVSKPETTTRSSALMPEVITRSSPTSWPISTVRCSTTSSLPATSR